MAEARIGRDGSAVPPARVIVPAAFEGLFTPLFPSSPAVPLVRYRSELPALLAAERQERDRLNWRGYVPGDGPSIEAPAPAPASSTQVPADGEAEAGSGLPHARLKADRLEDELLLDGIRRLATSGKRWPSAREFRDWTDERLSQEYDLARLDETAWPEGDPDTDWDDLEDADEVHPLYAVMRDVKEAQRAHRVAEATRVRLALRAWRAATEFLTGTPDAAINGAFHRSVMLELANDLQVAEQTAAGLVHAADDLEQRLPASWERFLLGEVPWRAMQMAHAAIDGLDEQFWGAFDEKAAHVLVTVAVPKLKQRLHEIRERIQATTAADRHEKALKRMFVRIEPAPDGMAYLTALIPAPEAVFIDLRLDKAARAAADVDGERRSIGQLRAHLLLDVIDEGLFRDARSDIAGLAVPQRRGVTCKVGLLIPAMTAMGHSDVPAVLEGYGPIDIETAKRLAGSASSWIKVLTDPVTGMVKDIGRDKYRPTDDMRAILGVLDGGGRGPGCTRPPSQTEIDHVDPFRQGLARGRTALDNLVLLSRLHHRIKTSDLWDIELQLLRTLCWTSFMGTRIITTVEPLPPTPVPEHLLASVPTPSEGLDWADPDQPDELDCPF